MNFFKKLFSSKPPEAYFHPAYFGLTETLSTQGFQGYLSTTIDIDPGKGRAFPLITEVEGIGCGFTIKWITDFFSDVLQCMPDFHNQCPNAGSIQSMRLELRKSPPPPSLDFARAVYDRRLHLQTTFPSSPAVTLIQRLSKPFASGWFLVCLAFKASRGKVRLEDGYQVLRENQARSVSDLDSLTIQQMESAAASYLSEVKVPFLTVHCLSSENPRFNWTALVQRLPHLEIQRTLPLLWNRSATEMMVNAYNTVRPASVRFREKTAAAPIRLDHQTGVMDFGFTKSKVKLIGSFREADFTWLWEWGRSSDAAPGSVRGIRSLLEAAFPKALLQAGNHLRSAFYDYILLAPMAAFAAGFPVVYEGLDQQNGVNTFFAVEKCLPVE